MKQTLRLTLLLLFVAACSSSPIPTPIPPTFGLVSIPSATVVYYDISGSTENDLRFQLDALGPVGYDGYHGDSTARWSITWLWPINPGGGCQLSETKVSYLIEVILPRWRPPEDASSELIVKWGKYISTLANHEQGHSNLVLANVRKVEEAIKAATCDTANSAGEMILSKIRQQDVDYDAITNHGATQGARFP